MQRIEAEIMIEAPAEAVWEAWADPERIASWYVDQAEGRIGRDRQVTWIWGQMGISIEYDVVEVEPDHRFVLRAETPDGERGTEVRLERENGRTRVQVVESGFDGDPAPIRSGWQMALGLLKVYVEVYYGRTVRSVLVMGKTEAAPEEVVALQRTEAGLGRWLESATAVPAEGEAVHFELESGVTLNGQVVRRTATETSLTWPEIEGVLELKQFPVGDDYAAAFRAFTWGDEREVDLEELQEVLKDALSRFVAALEPVGEADPE